VKTRKRNSVFIKMGFLSFSTYIAPSAVPTVHLMGASANTMSLSWLPPEKPNGIILDYEIKYHEKVRASVSQ